MLLGSEPSLCPRARRAVLRSAVFACALLVAPFPSFGERTAEDRLRDETLFVQDKCRIFIEKADLALKVAALTPESDGGKRARYVEMAGTLAREVRMGGMEAAPMWFGKSAVILIRIEILKGGREASVKMIKENLPALTRIHAALVEAGDPVVMKFTPIAECGYLLGSLNVEEGTDLWKAGKTEDAFGSKERAKEHYDVANAAYFRVFLHSDLRKAGVKANVETAFARLIPYEMAAGRFSDVVEYCKKYLDSFVEGRYKTEAERWIAEAEGRLKSEVKQ